MMGRIKDWWCGHDAGIVEEFRLKWVISAGKGVLVVVMVVLVILVVVNAIHLSATETVDYMKGNIVA